MRDIAYQTLTLRTVEVLLQFHVSEHSAYLSFKKPCVCRLSEEVSTEISLLK
jgi:hypothetical protein